MVAGANDITIEQGATYILTSRKLADSQDVASLSLSSSTVTGSILTGHEYSTNDIVFIFGANEDPYNGVKTLTVGAANTFTYPMTVTDDPDTPATGDISIGQIVDLTGYTARMQIRLNKSASATIIELTTENGRIVIDGTNGLITATLVSSDTAALDFNRGVYDLEIITGSTVERLLEGNVTLSKEVTR